MGVWSKIGKTGLVGGGILLVGAGIPPPVGLAVAGVGAFVVAGSAVAGGVYGTYKAGQAKLKRNL